MEPFAEASLDANTTSGTPTARSPNSSALSGPTLPLQIIVARLLNEAGFKVASELELHIDPDAHPKPDLVATRWKLRGAYPTHALDAVVEIVAEDEPFPHLKDKCRKYKAWGFAHVSVVDPSDRTVSQWNGALVETNNLAGIPAARIWHELDQQYDSDATDLPS